ncbi:MAG: tetratricopeptide repeat protein [Gammaproteobacteria bacterium]|nr:tetratricopeptide repeat protein [Gammaproteobacteria bacterium]
MAKTRRRHDASRTRLAAMLVLLAGVLAGCASNALSPGRGGPAGADGYAIREDGKLDGELQGDFDKALDHLRAGEHAQGIALLTTITRHPQGQYNTAPFINLAIAYRHVDKLESAEEALKKALAINPDHPAANNELGMVLRRSGRFAEARAAYERVLGKYPDYLPARKNLGILCDLYLGDLECAYEHYRLYSEAVPDDKAVTIWMADLANRRTAQ